MGPTLVSRPGPVMTRDVTGYKYTLPTLLFSVICRTQYPFPLFSPSELCLTLNSKYFLTRKV